VARRVGYLLDQIRLLGKEEKELKDEIVELARKYGIITPYTSYLIVEDETKRVSRNRLDAKYQTSDNASVRSYAQNNENKRRYNVIKEKSGKDSVEASRDFQTLTDTENINKIQKIEDKNFTVSNQFQIKNVMEKSFYQSGDFWNDSIIQEISGNIKIVKIKFASDEYFSLMKKNPEISKFLSIGKNIRFVFEKRLYEISE
jgi:Ca-activated chloride channel family protein